MGLFKRKSQGGSLGGGGGQQDWGEWMAERLPPEVQGAYRQAAGADRQAKAEAAGPDHFAESLERASSQPAPPGKVRGVARLIGGEEERAHVEGEAGSQATGHWLNAVLEIHIPGREPYEVRRKRLRLRRKDILGGGYPLLVDAGDPDSIEVPGTRYPRRGPRLVSGWRTRCARQPPASEGPSNRRCAPRLMP
jgi:hypothetical protein